MKSKSGIDKLVLFIEALLIQYALRMQFLPVLNKAEYKSGVHYLYALITLFLGEYDFNQLLLFVVLVLFLLWMRKSEYYHQYRGKILPLFFALCLLLGRSYEASHGWEYCFGGIFRWLEFLPALVGYTALFYQLLSLFIGLYHKAILSENKLGFFKKILDEHSFRKVFLLLLIAWMPVLILSYPGNLCYDVLGQIEQGMGMSAYSTHHPLLHTLIISGVIRGVSAVTGSNNFGLFVYILLQAISLATALAGTIARMGKRNVSYSLRLTALGIYLLAPMYSNMVSTAIKDIPFMAAVIWYILLMEELLHDTIAEKKPFFFVKLVLVEILVGLLRNNGMYMVVLSGIGFFVYFAKKGKDKKIRLTMLLCLVLLPLLGTGLCNTTMRMTLHAQKGSIGEMFCLPFQQTARYLQLYRGELTDSERNAIEDVLGSVDKVAESYHPDFGDYVKALYKKEATTAEIACYFKVWFVDFFKHPAVYFQAFFAHCYGWFDPGVSNAIRYEAESELFGQGMLFSGADKILLFVYRFVEYIPFLAILENVGIYTWLLFVLAGEAIRRKWEKGMLLLPLFISLLICMASPCFYLHPRYAYPIMFTLPFLYGVIGGKYTDGNNEE